MAPSLLWAIGMLAGLLLYIMCSRPALYRLLPIMRALVLVLVIVTFILLALYCLDSFFHETRLSVWIVMDIIVAWGWFGIFWGYRKYERDCGQRRLKESE